MANNQVIRKWVDALLSGEYPQAKGALRRQARPDGDVDEYYRPGFCCLGVLCELAVNADVIPEPSVKDSPTNGTVLVYAGSDTFLPDEVISWAGLDSDNPEVRVMVEDHNKEPVEIPRSLGDCNDEYDYTFADIAEAITETYLTRPRKRVRGQA